MNKLKKRKIQFEAVCNELAELFHCKNIDYGDSYFNTETEGFEIDKKLSKADFYLQVRRKISRLAQFADHRLFGKEKQNEVADETEEDTIRDLAIYCIMELVKRNEK